MMNTRRLFSAEDSSSSGPGIEAPRYEAKLQQDQAAIAAGLEKMAALSLRALRDGLTALRERDRQIAYAVIIRDQSIDALEREVSQGCLDFLVRHQPAGTYLRFAYAALRVCTELERIGDYAETIAHQAEKLAPLNGAIPYARFDEVAGLVLPMVENSLRAFVTQDAALARATIPAEDTIDLQKVRLRKDLVQMYQDRTLAFEALDPCLTITRRLERISDEARDICGEALFLCTGEITHHLDAGTFRILFLDRHNAGASLMAESIAESLADPRFRFGSAGMEPLPTPSVVSEFMREKGHDLSHRHAKALNEVPQLDSFHIVAVLHPEAKRLFPRQARKITFLDWPVEDPAALAGPPEAVRAACERAYTVLEQHLRALLRAIADEAHA
jgi:phosphate transport system protein